MSIHKTPSGKHTVRWREGNRNRSRSFTLKQDAQRFELEAKRIREMGGMLPDPKATRQLFEDFAMDWLANKGGISKETRENYLRVLSTQVFDDLGHVPLKDFTAPLIYRWQDARLRKGAGPISLRRARMLIGQVLQHAKGLGFISDNPAQHLAPIERKVPKRVAVPASPRQVEDLRNWMLERDRVGDATLISLLAYVGIRPQDALALGPQHIGPDRLRIECKNVDGQIRHGSKTGASQIRSVRVPAQVLSELRAWQLQTTSQTLLFPRASDGEPWRKTDWRNWGRRFFAEAVKDCGLPEGFRPYDCRHTAASIFLASGWKISEVAHQLGHSIDVCTKTYLHLIDEYHGVQPQPIEDVIAEARKPELRRAV